MWPNNVGILSMEIYFPSEYISQSDLELHDECVGKYTKGLGQFEMGFCRDSEDVYSICLTVASNLLTKNKINPKDIGFLEVGSETLLDKSKSIKTVLMKLFTESGNHDICGVDCKNACFGGTAALFNAIDWVESSSWDGRLALVVAGDIAAYSSKSARPTGGAGSVAILVGPDAPLIMDRGVRSHYMTDTYDFYKPDMNSEYPVVDGHLSIKCYQQALDHCYRLYKRKLTKNNSTISVSGDSSAAYFCFHSPFTKLVLKSFSRLLYLDMLDHIDPASTAPEFEMLLPFKDLSVQDQYGNRNLDTACLSAAESLIKQKVEPTTLISRRVGNMYTPSLYSCLISLIHCQPAESLLNQRVVLFSYGSGSTSCMYSLTITSDLKKLQQLQTNLDDLTARLDARQKVSCEEFLDALKTREEAFNKAPYQPRPSTTNYFPGTYTLVEVDAQFRRKYTQNESLSDV